MRVFFAIPGNLDLPTGGYRYDREVMAALPGLGVDVVHAQLPGSYPFPTEADRVAAATLLAALPQEGIVLIDGLAFGAFSDTELAALTLPVVALVHHPLALETGLDAATAAALHQSERVALARASAVIVTSAGTGDILVRDFGVSRTAISVAEPGVTRMPPATGSAIGGPVHIVALGAISPRKGYDVLVRALAALENADWRTTIAGSAALNPAAAAELRTLIAATGLEGRITLTGALDDASTEALLASADLFVFPSHYEGYGMVLTEALAHGLPVITTTGVPAGQGMPAPAVTRIPPNDPAALADAITRLMDAETRRSAASAAWALAGELLRWTMTATRIADVLRAQSDGRLTRSGTAA